MKSDKVRRILKEQNVMYYPDLLWVVGQAFEKLAYDKPLAEPRNREDIHDYEDGTSVSLADVYNEAEYLSEIYDHTDTDEFLSELLRHLRGED